MRIALSVWQGRISPVFDTARTLLVLDRDGTVERERIVTALADEGMYGRVAALRSLEVETLLCGAVSRPLVSLLETAGLKVFPFLTGEVEEILEAFTSGSLDEPQFLLPGCCGHRRGSPRRRRRCGHRKERREKL